jgi:hypothetical protein
LEEKVGLRSRKSRIRPQGSVALTTRPLYPQKLALTSPTSGGLLIGIVRSRTQATECAVQYELHPSPYTDSARDASGKGQRLIGLTNVPLSQRAAIAQSIQRLHSILGRDY